MERKREDRVRSSSDSGLVEDRAPGGAVVLAAHGSLDESAVNPSIRQHARKLAAAGFAEVAVAFHRGDPPFSRVLDELRARDVVVIPLMTSRGYYSDVVLPRELSKNRDFGRVHLQYTVPLGLHPRMPTVVARRLAQLLEEFSLEAPAVAIVGHGTPRHARSRESSCDLAADLASRPGSGPTEAFFLDDEPPLEKLRDFAGDRDLIVVPFLIGAGRHATRDIARRVCGLSLSRQLPLAFESDGRSVVLDRAVGEDPAIAELITDLAVKGWSRLAEPSSSPRR